MRIVQSLFFGESFSSVAVAQVPFAYPSPFAKQGGHRSIGFRELDLDCGEYFRYFHENFNIRFQLLFSTTYYYSLDAEIWHSLAVR